MASREEGDRVVEQDSHDHEISDTESGSSYAGSGNSSPTRLLCPYRSDDYHDQECSRFFDCPTHIVERSLSADDARSHSNDPFRDPSSAPTDAADGDREQEEEIYHSELEEAGSSASGHSGSVSPLSEDVQAQEAAEGSTAAHQRTSSVPSEQHTLDALADVSLDTAGPVPNTTSLEESSRGEPESATSDSGRGTTRSSDTAIPLRFDSLPLPPTPREPIGLPSPSIRPRNTRQPSEIVLPRWQPDAEVTLCPICHTQFSIFVRKHHCRKCGRVVCASCSPHRITIPYQYIVRPPSERSMNRYSAVFLGGDDVYGDFSTLGGGERVRLCNPCVPDPNTTPPQAPTSPNQFSPRSSHSRARNSISGPYRGESTARPFSPYFMTSPTNDSFVRNRSVTMASRAGSSHSPYYTPGTQSRILAGTPPAYYPTSSSTYRPLIPPATGRYRSLLDLAGAGPSSAASSSRPLPPPPQIPEEDECPVCHRELPSRDLPNFEQLRETHINSCISSHSNYGQAPPSIEQQATNTPPPRTVRRTGMFPYVATEKDCVDSAECTICLEEFEVGVAMARLECLCRFHRRCIEAWFVNHPGRCPVHQHDSYGY